MTLEDFFTLTEMKDGLRALSRVEELISVMQKEKDCVVNGGDAIRQWTAVASIISATESKDCLDLFVQLGGLFFIDKWLKVAEELVGNAGDSFVEELIIALLLALEKLCTDKGISIDSILLRFSSTLKNLFSHCSLTVQDVARKVFENLKLGDRDTISNTEPVAVVDPVNGRPGSSEPECSVQGKEQCIVNGNSDAIKAETMLLPISNGVETPKAKAVPSENEDGELQSRVQPPFDPPAPSVASDVESRVSDENTLPVEEISTIPPIKDERTLDMENAAATEASAAIDAVENGVPSNIDPSTESVAAGSSIKEKVEVVTEDNLCRDTATVLDLRETKVESVTNLKIEMDKDVVTQKGKNIWAGDCGPETVEKPSRYRDFGSVSILHTLGMDNKKSSKVGHGKKSIIELEYGIDDALEVARQVAQEVEGEMSGEDSRKSSGDVIMKSSSLDSFERQAMEGNSEESSTAESEPAEANPPEEEEQKSGAHDEKGVCVFDLNEEICTGDLEIKESVEARQEKHVCLNFDLNMSEVGDDTFVDTLPEKQVPVSLSVNSKDSVRSERLGLDLNSAGEDDDAVLEVAGQSLYPSPSSSSSQFHLPQRNFDLNDQPLPNNDFSDQFQKPSSSSTVSFPRSDPFISIMGARVEVNREPLLPHAPLYHSNGNFHDPSGGVFGVSSLFNLSRCNMMPPSHAISFSPPSYGPGDLMMMDPRVAPGGSGSSPFMLPQYSMPVTMNLGAGPSRPPQMDLNPGLLDNGGNKEQRGFFRQFLPPTPRVDDHEQHPGMFLQPLSGPAVGTKRKQPDGAWDFYPIQYGQQQQQSPWK